MTKPSMMPLTSGNETTDFLAACLIAFGQRFGSELLEATESGVLGLRYGSLDIVVEADDDNGVCLHTRLLPVPALNQLAFCQRLLNLNAFCMATGGAALAIDPDEHFVMLCARQHIDLLNETVFSAWLTGFIQHAEALHDLLIRDEFLPNQALRI